ncbi:glycosyltransferase family 2 protein [Paucibacter sp. B2R-40]|uniref:glycosyltransferase family 2 protein n=1 Tax=Paucibacter sp. B2R-40 TaxID=2893554 RepID=UPI0021E3A366|nr:glycosyltransferase family 2 protein [Paucibacter sp. B2R-40]MCV2353661.1 glycosyltransferase family 2 protein [Paucibacter sp. B2R-40]
MPEQSNIWVVIPAFNEGEVIRDVISELRKKYNNVVLVDDCSKDTTGSAALDGGAIVLRHPINLGQGAALQTGLKYAISQAAEYVVTFDADGQHRVEDIAVLMEVQKQSNADIVVGSRFLGSTQNLPTLKKIVLKLAVLFTRMTSGLQLTDAHNGLRLFTGHAAKSIKINQNRMAHASEIVDQILGLGLKVAEAPVTIIYTEYSIRKGQKISNAFNILAELFVGKITK